jgi:fumarate reductase subunit C
MFSYQSRYVNNCTRFWNVPEQLRKVYFVRHAYVLSAHEFVRMLMPHSFAFESGLSLGAGERGNLSGASRLKFLLKNIL